VAAEVLGDGFTGRVISFEPHPQAYAELAKKAGERHTCLNVGLGSQEGRAAFFVTKNSVNSSCLKPLNPTIRLNESSAVVAKREVVIRRLDAVMQELGLAPERPYLKIDTQGYEREVLRGAGQTLLRTDAAELELSLVELYEGQALLPEVWGILAAAGFRPAWLERGFRDPSGLWLMQVDGLFVREEAWRAAEPRDHEVVT
jgi:FkbM family methyltransferase